MLKRLEEEEKEAVGAKRAVGRATTGAARGKTLLRARRGDRTWSQRWYVRQPSAGARTNLTKSHDVGTDADLLCFAGGEGMRREGEDEEEEVNG
jgi:hypothetical protein